MDGPSDSKKKKRKRKKKKVKDILNNKNVGIYQDLIGKELPVRFKYRKVDGNSFGLTNEELLLATDQELNQWVSLKKMSQYREPQEEKYDIKAYQKKEMDLNLKKKIFKSLYDEDSGAERTNETEQTIEKSKKRKRKNKKVNQNSCQHKSFEPDSNKKNIHKKETNNHKNVDVHRLKAYGLSNNEMKRRKFI